MKWPRTNVDLMRWLITKGISPDGSVTLIEADRANTAHELAEKIRAQKVRGPEGEVEEHVNYVIDRLADDIDPKKEGQ